MLNIKGRNEQSLINKMNILDFKPGMNVYLQPKDDEFHERSEIISCKVLNDPCDGVSYIVGEYMVIPIDDIDPNTFETDDFKIIQVTKTTKHISSNSDESMMQKTIHEVEEILYDRKRDCTIKVTEQDIVNMLIDKYPDVNKIEIVMDTITIHLNEEEDE